MKNNYIWSIIESSSSILFQFLSLVVLSKILTPDDYGIFGMMSIFISVGMIISDSGLGGAIIQLKKTHRKDYSTLFWYNMIVSILCYSFILIFSSAIAHFYNTRELSKCLNIYGFYLIISAIGVVQNTILTKDLKFKHLAIVSIIANIFGFCTAIILALKGFGYWSLIWQHLVYMMVRVISQCLINHFIPRIEFSIASFREQFKFGGNLLFANILNVIYSNIASVIIPKIGTVSQNGYYLQASKIQNVPWSIVAAINDKVLFASLCKTTNNDELIQTARKFSKTASLIISTGIALVILFSRFLVNLLLGENWLEVANYLQILLIASFCSCYQYFLRNFLKSMGKTSIILKIDVYKSILGLCIMIFASLGGIYVLLWGVVLISLIALIYYIYMVDKISMYKFSLQLKDIKFSIVIFVISLLYILFRV